MQEEYKEQVPLMELLEEQQSRYERAMSLKKLLEQPLELEIYFAKELAARHHKLPQYYLPLWSEFSEMRLFRDSQSEIEPLREVLWQYIEAFFEKSSKPLEFLEEMLELKPLFSKEFEEKVISMCMAYFKKELKREKFESEEKFLEAYQPIRFFWLKHYHEQMLLLAEHMEQEHKKELLRERFNQVVFSLPKE